jgi:ATP-dependent phosphoenolpyruvate carboxykinase
VTGNEISDFGISRKVLTPFDVSISEHTFEINRERAIDYLNTRDNVYVFDGFAGWDPKYRIKVRVIASRAYHALFMVSLARCVSVDRRNMLDAD